MVEMLIVSTMEIQVIRRLVCVLKEVTKYFKPFKFLKYSCPEKGTNWLAASSYNCVRRREGRCIVIMCMRYGLHTTYEHSTKFST